MLLRGLGVELVCPPDCIVKTLVVMPGNPSNCHNLGSQTPKSVKIGGMSQSFAIPPAGQLMEVVRIVNEFYEAGEDERKTLNVQTKPLGETKVIGIHTLFAFNSFWLP